MTKSHTHMVKNSTIDLYWYRDPLVSVFITVNLERLVKLDTYLGHLDCCVEDGFVDSPSIFTDLNNYWLALHSVWILSSVQTIKLISGSFVRTFAAPWYLGLGALQCPILSQLRHLFLGSSVLTASRAI